MTVAKIEWKSGQKGLLVWTSVILLLVVLFMSIFPAMQSSGMKDMVNNSLDSLPKEMLKIFHLKSGPSLIEPIGYFSYVFQYVFIGACIFSSMTGTKALVKEETDGTIEFLFSQPVSRLRIVLEKFLISLVSVCIFWVVSFVGVVLTMKIFTDSSVDFTEFVKGVGKIMGIELIILFLFLSIGFFFSSILPSSNSAISVSLGLVFGFYLMGIFADLQDNVSFLKDLSPVYQGIPSNILANDNLVQLVLIVGGLSILFLLMSCLIYRKRDLKI